MLKPRMWPNRSKSTSPDALLPDTDGRLPERRLLNYKKLLAEAAHAKRREETARKKQLRSVERKKNPVRKKQYKAE